MKKSRILLLLGLLPILMGFDTSKDGYPCPPRHVNVITKDGSETKPSKLEVKPDTIRVMSGCSFELSFPGGRTVSTSTKSGKSWLNKSSTSASPIIIKVPLEEVDGIYKYEVKVDGFGTLDPRARVKN